MSVHYGFTVEMSSLGIVYKPVWHVMLMMPYRDGAEVVLRLSG